MPGAPRPFSLHRLIPMLLPFLALAGCSASPPPRAPARPPVAAPAPLFIPPPVLPVPEKPMRVLLGIDVLEADGFAAVKGKRLGLLTHSAGVNRQGVSTIDVLRRAPGVQLVALYAVEHGIHNQFPAEKPFPDATDPRTGLPVFSLYNGKTRNFRPTPAQLKNIDALVVDLQDIGTRSYTFSGAMKTAMEACFENGKELIVLDRPNPLGGQKVDGPLLDANLMSDVGKFRVPYVHGLTMGELAQMARATLPPGGLEISAAARQRGKLTVIPMRGWTRSMRWPETGLAWVPTSGLIQDFAAVQGYPMTGLGCIIGGFKHGFRQAVGSVHAFRGILHLTAKPEVYEKELRALNLPGIAFRRISVASAKTGQPTLGLFIEITDYDAWQPAELNFHLMKLACKLEKQNPFARATTAERRSFKVHVGSDALFNELVAKGARIDLDTWLRTWREQARIYQEQSKRYWLYR